MFPNGTRKEVLPAADGGPLEAGTATVVYFSNGDVKQTAADGRVRYYFERTRTTQVSLPGGAGELFSFGETGQMERHTPDGRKVIGRKALQPSSRRPVYLISDSPHEYTGRCGSEPYLVHALSKVIRFPNGTTKELLA